MLYFCIFWCVGVFMFSWTIKNFFFWFLNRWYVFYSLFILWVFWKICCHLCDLIWLTKSVFGLHSVNYNICTTINSVSFWPRKPSLCDIKPFWTFLARYSPLYLHFIVLFRYDMSNGNSSTTFFLTSRCLSLCSQLLQAARNNVLLAVPALLYAINNYLKFIMQVGFSYWSFYFFYVTWIFNYLNITWFYRILRNTV